MFIFAFIISFWYTLTLIHKLNTNIFILRQICKGIIKIRCFRHRGIVVNMVLLWLLSISDWYLKIYLISFSWHYHVCNMPFVQTPCPNFGHLLVKFKSEHITEKIIEWSVRLELFQLSNNDLIFVRSMPTATHVLSAKF